MTTVQSRTLAQLAGDVIDNNPDDSDAVIACLVADRISDDEMRTFLIDATIPIVADIRRRQRNSVMNQAIGKANGGSSARMQRRRDWWQKLLTEHVHIETGQKAIGDCTADDLRFVIAERVDHVQAVTEQVRKFEIMLDAVETHNVACVKDLPEGAVTFQ